MAKATVGQMKRAIDNAKGALQALINCGETIAQSRAAVKAVIANDPEGEWLLAIFEQRFGLAIVPIEMIEA